MNADPLDADPPERSSVEPRRRTARRAWTTAVRWIAGLYLVVALATAAAWIIGEDHVPPLIALVGVIPSVLLPSYVVAAISISARRRWLSAFATIAAMVHVSCVLPPLLSPPDLPAPSPTAEIRLFVANVYRANTRFDEVIEQIRTVDPDVLVLIEMAPRHVQDFDASGLNARYPSTAISNAVDYSVAIYARAGVSTRLIEIGPQQFPAATIDTASGRVQIVGVHATAPKSWELAASWRRSFDRLDSFAAESSTVLAGDFNSSRWHGPFRRLISRGWTDAHDAAGEALTGSWGPANRLAVFGPVMRLDHVLVGTGATAGRPVDLEIPGSDHNGILVDVAPRAP